MSHLIKIYAVCKFSYFCLWYLTLAETLALRKAKIVLTLLHSERPKLYINLAFQSAKGLKRQFRVNKCGLIITTGWERTGHMRCIVDTSLSILMTLRMC